MEGSSPYRLIKALLREPVDCTPVWLMRQAGRYLPEYRLLRARAGSFMNLCTNPEDAAEVTLQPLRRFDLDAAILFSDILVVPDAMGCELRFTAGEGPSFKHPVKTPDDVATLPEFDPKNLGYVYETVERVKAELAGSKPLIGFAGSPWTLAMYMIEGKGSKDFAVAKTLMYQNPPAMHALLHSLAEAVASHLNAQIEAGADAVMIFDTWGGLLSTSNYLSFSLQYIQQIIEKLIKVREGQRIPNIVFTKGGGHWLEYMATTGANALGLDWTVPLGEAYNRVGNRVALQGNLDPIALMAPPNRLVSEVHRTLDAFGDHSGHVFNLGHGVLPMTDPDHVKILVDTVHAHRI